MIHLHLKLLIYKVVSHQVYFFCDWQCSCAFKMYFKCLPWCSGGNLQNHHPKEDKVYSRLPLHEYPIQLYRQQTQSLQGTDSFVTLTSVSHTNPRSLIFLQYSHWIQLLYWDSAAPLRPLRNNTQAIMFQTYGKGRRYVYPTAAAKWYIHSYTHMNVFNMQTHLPQPFLSQRETLTMKYSQV